MASKRQRPNSNGPFYLAAWMDALGVSDRKLCELIDVSQPAVSRWRSGARLPRRYATEDNQIRDPVVTIARALTKLSGTKVNPSDLWTSPASRALRGRVDRNNSHPMRTK